MIRIFTLAKTGPRNRLLDFLNSLVANKRSNCKISFYIFYTSCDATIAGVKFVAFLSPRCGYYLNKKKEWVFTPPNPVLRHIEHSDLYRRGIKTDESIITRKQAIDQLDFKVVILFTSSFKINAHDVEEAYSGGFNICLSVADFGVNQIREQK